MVRIKNSSQPGFEPGSKVPETFVLPLHHWDILASNFLLTIFDNFMNNGKLFLICIVFVWVWLISLIDLRFA